MNIYWQIMTDNHHWTYLHIIYKHILNTAMFFTFSASGSTKDTSAGKGDEDPTRAMVCERLRGMPYMKPSSPQFMFGRGYAGPLKAPKVLWKSDQPPRKDHSCPKWLTATEFEDVPEVPQCAGHDLLVDLVCLSWPSRRSILGHSWRILEI